MRQLTEQLGTSGEGEAAYRAAWNVNKERDDFLESMRLRVWMEVTEKVFPNVEEHSGTDLIRPSGSRSLFV